MSSPKPLGIFWDINDSSIPLLITTNECIKHLRQFVSNKFKDNCIEYEMNCVSPSNLINHSIIQSLKGNGCDVLHIDSNTEINVFIKLDQMVRQFIEKYGSDTIVVLISNNSYLSSTIRLMKHREVSVLWICGQNANQGLSDWIPFDDVFQLNRTVMLSITNIPNDKSRKTIRNSFIPFCQQFNCKFRFNRKESVKLEFNNLNDANRAQLTLSELTFFGQDLNVEVMPSDDNCNGISSSSVCSSSSSLVSLPSNTVPRVGPQNDDKCKSVIIGIFTKYNQNVVKLVRHLIIGWNDPSINESMICRVNRERDFIGRDGKASLIVTACDRQSNEKLITSAKKYFVDRENKLYWNRLQRSKKDVKQQNNCQILTDKRSQQKILPSNQSLHSNSSIESNDEYLPQRTDTVLSYASITSKPSIIENMDSNVKQTSMKRFDLDLTLPRRRNVSTNCRCQ